MQKFSNKGSIIVGVIVTIIVTGVVYSALKHQKSIKDRIIALGEEKVVEIEPEPDLFSARIYFADEQYENLIAETRELEVPAESDEKIRQVIEELIKGPDADEHYRTVPESAMLTSVFIRDDIALVEFDENLLSSKFGLTGELFCINSIYRTVLDNSPEIRGVRIIIEGNEGATLNGDEAYFYTGVFARHKK